MMPDPTENIRRALIETGAPHADLAEVEAKTDQTWTTDQLREDFDVVGFMAPFVVVRRKADGVKGSLEFTHSPRVYFNFTPDTRTTPAVKCRHCGALIPLRGSRVVTCDQCRTTEDVMDQS